MMSLNSITFLISTLFVYLAGIYVSRLCSSYFYEAKCGAYIIIKNSILQTILIGQSRKSRKTGRIVEVSFECSNRMSYVGCLAHILINVEGLSVLIVSILKVFGVSLYPDLDVLLLSCLIVFILLFLLIDTINNKEV